MFAMLREELRERVEVAREAYGAARGEGQDRVSAGLAAMRAALEKQREAPEAGESVRDRLRRMLGREVERSGAGGGSSESDDVRARLDDALGSGREQDAGREHEGRFVDRQVPERAPTRPTTDREPREGMRLPQEKPAVRVRREREDGWER